MKREHILSSYSIQPGCEQGVEGRTVEPSTSFEVGGITKSATVS